MRRHVQRRALMGATAALALVGAAPALAASGISRGPSTTTDPYVLPVADGVHVRSLITVANGTDPGAAENGYRYVGIPDGIGATRRGNRITVLSNHELAQPLGLPRRHGFTGAFVSKLEINRRSGAVTEGSDFINPGTRFWDYVTQTYSTAPSAGGPNPRVPGDVFVSQTPQFGRFCSSTLSDRNQFWSSRDGVGTSERIYFGNEEAGNEGRSFGILANGDAQQLPRLGLFSWENTKLAYNRSATTLVAGLEDGGSAQLWLYAGQKTRRGDKFERAGLTNGSNYVIDVVDEAVSTDAQFRATYGKGTAADVDLSEVNWDQSGQRQNDEAAAKGLSLTRIEDGVWDKDDRNVLYFATTEGGDKTASAQGGAGRDGGGIWKLEMKDIEKPELGGKLTLLLDGTEAPHLNKPDNLDLDSEGNLMIQEDPGTNPHLARIVAFDVEHGKLGVVAQFDAAQFAPLTVGGTDAPFTTDEESSGIIDASELLGKGWFLFDAQVHKPNPDPELVEYGQLMAMHVDDFDAVYGEDE